MLSRIDWYFGQQRGVCYLRISDGCKNRRGAMRILTKQKRQPHDMATWDHLYPRQQRQQPRDTLIQLLACSQCNGQRGDAPARPEHIALGDRLRSEYDANRRLRRHRRRLKRADIRAMQREVSATREQLDAMGTAEAIDERQRFELSARSTSAQARARLDAEAQAKPPEKQSPGLGD